MPAFACECINRGSPEDHVASTKIIAVGQIISAEVLSESEQEAVISFAFAPTLKYAQAVFRVISPIKGADDGEEVTVFFDVSESDCSMEPLVGHTQVLFIDDWEGKNFAFGCSMERYWGNQKNRYIDLFEDMTGEDFSYLRR